MITMTGSVVMACTSSDLVWFKNDWSSDLVRAECLLPDCRAVSALDADTASDACAMRAQEMHDPANYPPTSFSPSSRSRMRCSGEKAMTCT